jgi:hypothetical protein
MMKNLKIEMIISIGVALLVATFLTGCPRIAYISLYNNTGVDIRASDHGEHPKSFLVSGSSVKFGFTGSFVQRNIPLGGKDGPHFDGTLRLQINADGRIYALKGDELPPLVEFPTPPTGYPLMPTSGSSPTP